MDPNLLSSLNNQFFEVCSREYLKNLYKEFTTELLSNDERFHEELKIVFLQKLPFLKGTLINNKIFNEEELIHPCFKVNSEQILNNYDTCIKTNEGYTNSAKINLTKLKILIKLEMYTQYLQIPENRETNLEKTKREILEGFQNLNLLCNLNEIGENSLLQDKSTFLNEFDRFFTEFICELPENFKFADDLDSMFTIDLEVENSIMDKFTQKKEENRVKYEAMTNLNKSGKKRTFSEMSQNKEEEVEVPMEQDHHLLGKKKRSSQDNNLENKELVFKNVKEKIYSHSLISSQQEMSTKFTEELTESTPITPNIRNIYFGDENSNFIQSSQEILNNNFASQHSIVSNKSRLIGTIFNKASSQSCNNFSYLNIAKSTSLNTNSNSNSNLTLTQNSQSINNLALNYNTNLSNNLNTSIMSQQSDNNSIHSLANIQAPHSLRSNSIPLRMGINSNISLTRGVSNVINTRKPKMSNSARKRGKDKIIDKFFEKIQSKVNEEAKEVKKESKRKSTNSNANKNTHVNNLQKIVHKKFYAKERELKTPSPLPISTTKYSKKRLDSAETNKTIAALSTNINNENTNSNHSLINSNSNSGLSTFNDQKNNLKPKQTDFSLLVTRSNNKPKNSESSNFNSEIKDKLNFPDNNDVYVYEGISTDFNTVTFNKFGKKAKLKENESKSAYSLRNRSQSVSKNDASDDDILAYSTPTKVEDAMKFGKKSPNKVTTRVNLMNLFKQFGGVNNK